MQLPLPSSPASKPRDENPAATIGCILGTVAIAVVLIATGQVNVSAWFNPSPPVGRYQIVGGRIHNDAFSKDEVAAMVKIDTATGKTWVLFPEETSSGAMNLTVPNRWEDVTEPRPSLPQTPQNK